VVELFWLELIEVVVVAWFTIWTRAHDVVTPVVQGGLTGVELVA
jgi:hypothetical protein